MNKRRSVFAAVMLPILLVAAFSLAAVAEAEGKHSSTMDFVIWNKETKSSVSVQEDEMNIVDLESDQIFAPRLIVTNESFSDIAPVITMNVNGKNLSWKPITITPGESKRLIASESYSGAGLYIYTINIDGETEFFGTYEVKEPSTAEEQFQMGYKYYNGNGVEQSYKKAIEWYTKAAEQGYAAAQHNLGLSYYKMGEYEKAVEWYTRAAEQGLAISQNSLGVCYKDGLGVEKDISKALEWYWKAADQNYSSAQYNLGLYYDEQNDQKRQSIGTQKLRDRDM